MTPKSIRSSLSFVRAPLFRRGTADGAYAGAVAATVIGLLLYLAAPALAAFDQSHKLWTQDLRKHVAGPVVNYAKWKKSPQTLNRYLQELAAITPEEYEKFSEDEKKALWINAYNAITVDIILEHYPISGHKPYYPSKSMRQIPNVWEDFQYKVAGKKVNLYEIEHNIIRRDFRDPRMHFAVVCGSRGCPELKGTAYVAETLDSDLDQATKKYFADPKNVEYDLAKKEVRVSRLFSWFPLDFAAAAGVSMLQQPPPSDDSIVLAYVLKMAPIEVQQKLSAANTRVVYKLFDWTLNDSDIPVVKQAVRKKSG